jgi:beta-glucosidase
LLANTWDLDLAKKMGNCLADDCIEQDVDVLLAPGVNIKRLPTNGRNFEYLSEDPLLTGLFAKSYIEGVQEKHVGTSLKHFCCNNMEYSRHWISSEVDERTLREIYLKPFEIAIKAQPWTIMSSYNLVNGVRMSEHKKLYNVLRKEFGFKGLIISDWDAVKNRTASLKAGLDLAMPFNKKDEENLISSYEQGLISEEEINESANRVLSLINKCKEAKVLRKVETSVEERSKVSQLIAENGMVLLKNDGILPLSTQKTIVTGSPARNYYSGGGSSKVVLNKEYKPLDEALKEEGLNAFFYESVWETNGEQSHMGNLKECVRQASLADAVIVTVGNDSMCEVESRDRQHIYLSKEQEDAIIALSKVNPNVVVVIYAGAPIDMTNWIDDVKAILWAGYGGENVNQAVSRIITGKVNPSGKLSETFPLHLEDHPAYHTYLDEAVIRYSEGLDVGYRYFDTYNIPVLFPLGFGLSYSNFEYTNLKVNVENEKVIVTFDITNTSTVDGQEVAQVYVREITKEVYRPYKELKGFKKVFIKHNETVSCRIELDESAFAYYSTAIDDWKVNSGVFEILVGTSSRDILLKSRIVLNNYNYKNC